MSKEEDIQAQTRALIEQYIVLQNYAESLQRDLNTVIGVLSEIRLAKETISSLKDEKRNEFEEQDYTQTVNCQYVWQSTPFGSP